jgi:glutamine synthetase
MTAAESIDATASEPDGSLDAARTRVGGIVARLEALDASALWVVYHDYAGLGRAKAVPRDRFPEVARDGVTFAMANWDLAITDEQVPHPIFGADSGDFRAVPDPAAIVPIPHRPGVAQAFAWLTDDLGASWPGDPRWLLARQVERLASLGLAVRTAFEWEFVLVPVEVGAAALHASPDRMFTVDALDARWPFGSRVMAELDAAGVAVHQFAKEYGPAQFELSLLPRSPVAAADGWLLARQLVKAIARDAGLVVSGMPKPFEDVPGNGLHVHLGLDDLAEPGRDLLGELDDPDALTPLGRAAVAGLLAHAGGQTALAAPSPNSPKRLLPGSWAPAHVAWAFGNRASLVRIPGRGAARHLEYRSGDATASPYLHLTGLLAAIADGVERPLEAPPPAAVDVGHLDDAAAAAAGMPRLPATSSAALDALIADPVLMDALGPVVATHYPEVKRFEHDQYRDAGGDEGSATVTEWEREVWFEHV